MASSTEPVRDASPIFIIGCPRSGNTILGAILNKHPQALILFETNAISYIYRRWLRLTQKGGQEPLPALLTILDECFDWRHRRYDITETQLREAVEPGAPDFAAMFDRYVRYFMSRTKPTATRWGDKTPHHMSNLRQIRDLYPNAKLLYTYRDPRAVVGSMSKETFPDSPCDPIFNAEVVRHYLEEYDRQRKLHADVPVMEIRYEDLVSEPERVVREMCQFVGLEYTPVLLEEADDYTRELSAYPWDKAWGKITPQPVLEFEGAGDYVEAYLADWISRQGYPRKPVSQRWWRSTYAHLHNLPMRTTRHALSWVWSMRYPGFPFLMQDYPGRSTLWNYLTGGRA